MRESLYDRCVQTGNEALLSQWDARNAPLTPQTVSCGSHRKLWWRCAAGHTWQAAVYSRARGADCPYCRGKAVLADENSLAARRPSLADEWDAVKNAPLTPDAVVLNSHRLVWWRCARDHSWRASIKSRAEGCGCPVCAGRVAKAGENTLFDRFPLLSAEFDLEKNAPLTPRDLLPGTTRRVWWRCARGHSWRAAVSSRTAAGNGCPVCAGRAVLPGENDLQTVFPALAAQWDYEKNDGVTPDQVAPSANRRVWWNCDRGHTWLASVAARAFGGTGCPYCTNTKVLPGFNDLATVRPLVAAQWDAEQNGALTARDVLPGSHRKVWWRCSLGHSWQAAIYARTGPRATDCPYCAGKPAAKRK